MWAGIHRTQDIVKSYTNADHVKRVITRENTPWVKHSLVSNFENRKDPFVQKYQILLNHVQKEKDIVRLAEKEREKIIQQSVES